MTGATELWEMNGFALKAAQQIAAPSTQWSIAGTGDFDDDGKSDLLWHNDVTGATELWEMNGFALKAAQQIAAPSWHAVNESYDFFLSAPRTDLASWIIAAS